MKAELHSTSLQQMSIASCKGVTLLRLACPALAELSVDECDQLERACLRPIGAVALALGTCPSLVALEIAAPAMCALDIRCGLSLFFLVGRRSGLAKGRPVCYTHLCRADAVSLWA